MRSTLYHLETGPSLAWTPKSCLMGVEGFCQGPARMSSTTLNPASARSTTIPILGDAPPKLPSRLADEHELRMRRLICLLPSWKIRSSAACMPISRLKSSIASMKFMVVWET